MFRQAASGVHRVFRVRILQYGINLTVRQTVVNCIFAFQSFFPSLLFPAASPVRMAQARPPPSCQVELYTHDLSSGAWIAEDVWVYTANQVKAVYQARKPTAGIHVYIPVSR